MIYSDDPAEDFSRYDRELENRSKELPECYLCGEPILDEYCYEINGELICEKCLDENYKVRTDDYTDQFTEPDDPYRDTT